MFGHDGWRPLTVAVLVSGAVFLPPGVASATPPDSLTCEQVRNARVDCTPLRHDGVDGVFIGPVSGSREPNKGSTSPAGAAASGSSAAGTATTGSATTGPGTSGPGTSGPGTTGPGTSGSSPAGSSGTSDAAAGGSTTGGAAGGAATGGAAPGQPSTPAPPIAVPPSPVPVPDPGRSTTSAGAPTSTDASDDDSADAKTDEDDDEDSDSKRSSGSSSDDSDSSSSSSGSSGGSYSGTTSAGSVLGAASCPSTVGTGSVGTGSAATGPTPTSARGSVTAGAQASQPEDTDPQGAASLTDVTGNTVGTATRATSQALAATAGAASSVAGAALGAAATANGGGNASMPGDVLNLGYWYLTLPTGQQGSPDTIENPMLGKFTNNFFKLNPTRDGVVFSADGAGVTTKNSHYPRSELREMNGSEKAAWSNMSGTHTLDVCEAITKVPSAKPHVVAAQIHDGNDDVMQIRLEGQTLMVRYNDGKSQVVMDPNYTLGTPYNVRIVAANGKVDVLYNGEKKAELPLSGSGWYWKVGAYVQSNESKGDGAGSVGEVTVYTLNCVHA